MNPPQTPKPPLYTCMTDITQNTGLLCHMLFLGGRQPSKIMFARDSGKVFQTDMMPLYNER